MRILMNGEIHMKNLKTHLYLRKNWDTFNFNTFKDFHDRYLKKDLL